MKLRQKKYARQVFLALYGINICTANKILGLLKLHPRALGYYLFTKKYYTHVQVLLSSLRIQFRLRLIVFSRLCLQLFLGTYRGVRLLQGLPSHGQRTHGNAKTSRRLKSMGLNFPFNIKRSQAKALAIQRVLDSSRKHGKGLNKKNSKAPLKPNKNKNDKNVKQKRK